MRLTGTDYPVVCTICKQPPAAFDPKPEYVDFQTGHDGPMVDNPDVPGEQVYIENIVICEGCFKEAARLLNLTNADEMDRVLDAWKAYADSQEKELEAKDRTIRDLSFTVGTLIDKPVRKVRGKPQLKGPESHDEELKEMRSRRDRAEKIRAKQKADA